MAKYTYELDAVLSVDADSDDEARRLFTSLQQAFVNIRRGNPAPLPPPVDVDALTLTKSITNQQSTRVQSMNMLFCDGHAAPVSVKEAWNAIHNPGTNMAAD